MNGFVAEKCGKLYAVIKYKNEENRIKTKWISTGLDIKGNKRNAEKILRDKLVEFEKRNLFSCSIDNKILFADYLEQWLESVKENLQVSSYAGYKQQVKKIANYFRQTKIKLVDIKPVDIRNYYNYLQAQGKSVQLRQHYHVNIRKCLQSAVKSEMIISNPADKVDRPKSPKFIAKYYNEKELEKLFEVLENDKYKFAYVITAYYGLRRSEILGLKWSAIDFEKNTVSINHSVIETRIDGKKILIQKNNMKNKSSYRVYPLLPIIKDLLLKEKEKQEEYKKFFGKNYNNEYKEYICVQENGNLFNPSVLSSHLKLVIKQNNLKQIRFHELRHSCASLLLSMGINMKQIQEWLGHSTYNTTADIYSHLDFKSKMEIASNLTAFSNKVEELNQDDKKEPFKPSKYDQEIEELEKQLAQKRKLREEEMC